MRSFGRTADGIEAQLFVLEQPDGTRIEITNYGGTIVRWWTPDREGRLADVALGMDTLAAYEARSPYFGALVGRFANRIAHGRFTLDERVFQLATNNRPAGIPCHLHGGRRGFDRAMWKAAQFDSPAGPALRLQHESPDGDEGYPGRLVVTVTYTLSPGGELRIDYEATTDQPTPVNLTNHCYFNLAGESETPILGHVLTLRASHYTPVSPGLIPTGEIAPIAGTPFDFLAPRPIGEWINASHEQLRRAGGYDHNFVIDRVHEGLNHAATVFEPQSGRMLEVRTTEPGVQFYSGNFLDGSFAGKNGHRYPRRSGFCLETQHFPDSPNQPAFPSTILRPGEVFRSSTVYRISAV